MEILGGNNREPLISARDSTQLAIHGVRWGVPESTNTSIIIGTRLLPQCQNHPEDAILIKYKHTSKNWIRVLECFK